jgi:ketosteroid isomerase-like protein
MKKIFLLLTVILCLMAFNNTLNSGSAPADKTDLFKMEKEFSDYVKKEGIAAGFAKYAAEDAVASRNGNLIKGRNKINEFYNQTRSSKDKLEWTAEFADISASGDMGYTYGKYIYTAYDSAGVPKEYKGIFHTVWKKQKDGGWKFVYD